MGVSGRTDARTSLRRLVVSAWVSSLSKEEWQRTLACALDTAYLAIILATADVGEYAFNKRQMRSRKSSAFDEVGATFWVRTSLPS